MKSIFKDLFKTKEQRQLERIETRVMQTAKTGHACMLISDMSNEDFTAYMKKTYDVDIIIQDGGTKYKVFRVKKD